MLKLAHCTPGSRHSLVISLFIAFFLLAHSAQALTVRDNYHALSTQFGYLEDPGGTLTLDDVLRQSAQYQFASSRDSKPKGIYSAIWLKLELSFSQESIEKNYHLYGRMGNLYDIRVYRPDQSGVYREWVTGEDYPASTREMDTLRYGFSIPTQAQPYSVYIRFVGGPGTNNLSWDLVEEKTYIEKTHTYYNLDLICLSGIGALLLFNLIIALSLRRKDHLYYSAYVASVMMALMCVDGICFYYLWPETPALNGRAQHSFNLFSAAMRLLAIMSFLDIARLAPRWYWASGGVLLLLAATFLAVNAVGITNLPPYAATLPWAIGILFGFAVCLHAIKLKIKLALPLLITLLVPGSSAILQGLLTVNDQHVDVLALQLAKMGFALHVLMFSLCLAAQTKIQAESHRVALHDRVTGLPGATLLEERFDWATKASRRGGQKIAVAYIDLDGFKAVNDTLGHAAGDQLLADAAARMQGILRQTDFVARVGGDEFIVLLPDLQRDYIIGPVVDKLLATLAAPYNIVGEETRITASIGIALFPDDGKNLEILTKTADSAMYDAKRKGKNCYSFARPKVVLTPTISEKLTTAANESTDTDYNASAINR